MTTPNNRPAQNTSANVAHLLDIPAATQISRQYSSAKQEYRITLEDTGHRPDQHTVTLAVASSPVISELANIIQIETVRKSAPNDSRTETIIRRRMTSKMYAETEHSTAGHNPAVMTSMQSSALCPEYESLRMTARDVFNQLAIADTGGHLLSPFYRLQWGTLLKFGAGLSENWLDRFVVDPARSPIASPVIIPQDRKFQSAPPTRTQATPTQRFGYLGYVYGKTASSFGRILNVPSTVFGQYAMCPTISGMLVYQYKAFSLSRAAVYTGLANPRTRTEAEQAQLLTVNLADETAIRHWGRPPTYLIETGHYNHTHGFQQTGHGTPNDRKAALVNIIAAHSHLSRIIPPPPTYVP